MSNVEIEQQAREILATEYERGGAKYDALELRAVPLGDMNGYSRMGIRAVVTALNTQPSSITADRVERACRAFYGERWLRLEERDSPRSWMRDALIAGDAPQEKLRDFTERLGPDGQPDGWFMFEKS